jgi:hypothetical protein
MEVDPEMIVEVRTYKLNEIEVFAKSVIENSSVVLTEGAVSFPSV